jgi:methionyl-tRNA formyltransferase
MRILIFGSTYLTKVCVAQLVREGYEIVGFVPNERKPTVPGDLELLGIKKLDLRSFSLGYDIGLSLQYDRRIDLELFPNTFNLHTGLLPDWGGVDILYYTLYGEKRAEWQGLSFHKITIAFDAGPLISTISYPVFDGDKIFDLYMLMVSIAPSFLMGCLKLLQSPEFKLDSCRSYTPVIYRRAHAIDNLDYQQFPSKISEWIRHAAQHTSV